MPNAHVRGESCQSPCEINRSDDVLMSKEWNRGVQLALENEGV